MSSFCFDSLRRAVLAALTPLAICGIAQAQAFNVYEGQSQFENNWSDSSWNVTEDLANTSYIYEGSTSAQLTYTQAWAGFRVTSNLPFPAGYFSAMHLSITGGPTAGRSISVYFLVNGVQTASINLNRFIQGGSVAAKVWRTATIPLSTFNIKPTDVVNSFTLQESSGGAQPAFWIGNIGWTPVPVLGPVKVAVNAGNVLRTVDPKHFGVNTDVWISNFTSSANTSLLSQSKFKSYRFPGGSASDGYNWVNNMNTDASGNTWGWSTNFDQFASVAVGATGGQCFITANYGSGTPAEAAAWVKYSNVTQKYGFKYWEIGNEVYGTWEQDEHPLPNDPVTYAKEFAQYYQQMKAVDPTIQVGAVTTPGEDLSVNYPNEIVTNPVTGQQHSGWTAVMLSTMAGLGVTPDFIIYHRYPEYAQDSDFSLLVCNSSWFTDIADLRMQLTDYLGSAGAKVQIMCTENNSDAAPPGKQMCSLVNAVFMADSFATVLQTECDSFLWWDWINGPWYQGQNGDWLYGWRMYGDEGVISPDFTMTYPTFYAEQMINLFAAPGDQVLQTTSSYGLLSSLVTKRSDGSLRLLVVNKHPTQEIATQFNFSGYTPIGPATLYQYGMTQDNAAKAGKPQIISTTTIKSWPAKTTYSFPPYSISVIVFTKHA